MQGILKSTSDLLEIKILDTGFLIPFLCKGFRNSATPYLSITNEAVAEGTETRVERGFLACVWMKTTLEPALPLSLQPLTIGMTTPASSPPFLRPQVGQALLPHLYSWLRPDAFLSPPYPFLQNMPCCCCQARRSRVLRTILKPPWLLSLSS